MTGTKQASDAVTPFHLHVPEAALEDLRDRLARTRWPERETVSGWEQGVPLDRARALADYWQHEYDWRRCEAALNAVGQFKTVIDGLELHFLHRRSPNPNALPLVLTHGWPGSVIEFLKVIGPLTDPEAHGGRAEEKQAEDGIQQQASLHSTKQLMICLMCLYLLTANHSQRSLLLMQISKQGKPRLGTEAYRIIFILLITHTNK